MKRKKALAGGVWAAAPLLAFIAVLLASCISVPVAVDVGERLRTGKYERALKAIEEKKRAVPASIYNQKNDISYLLDRGLLAYYMGDYKTSSTYLLESERRIEEAFTKDISDNFARFATRDPYKAEYGGEDFENIYVNVFNALNYYHGGDIENAQVEIRRMNEKLPWIKSQYEIQKQKLAEKFKTLVWGETSYFTNSALARYMGLLFWRARGREDDARIDAQELNAAFAGQERFYQHTMPPELVMRPAPGGGETCDELSIPAGMARLNVLSFTGLSPYKMTLLGAPAYGPSSNNSNKTSTTEVSRSERPSAFKVLGFRPSPVDRIEVAVDGGERFSLSLLEPIGKVAQEIFESRDIHTRSAKQGKQAHKVQNLVLVSRHY